jgi:SAM-dependent methyltransferase
MPPRALAHNDRGHSLGHVSRAPVPSDRYTSDYFLHTCDGFEEFHGTAGLPSRLHYALALADLRAGQLVLDIGCGRGEVLRYAAERGARALGVDYAAAALSLARGHLGDLRRRGGVLLARGDVSDLGLRPDSVDRILVLDVVEHLTPVQLEGLVAVVHRTLRAGGVAVFHTSPNRWYLDFGYRWYTRWVNRLLNRVFGTGVGPVSAHWPRADHDLELHINEQTPLSLYRTAARHGFAVRLRCDNHAEWATGGKTRLLAVLNRLSPLSHVAPLSWLLANDIWLVARKRRV